MPSDTDELRDGLSGISLQPPESQVDTLRARVRVLEVEQHELLLLIFTRTRLCPFGGGRNGERSSCAFGSPGCACNDWVEENREALAGGGDG